MSLVKPVITLSLSKSDQNIQIRRAENLQPMPLNIWVSFRQQRVCFDLGSSKADVGGQRCPDSVRIYCAMSGSQNLKFFVKRVFECPDFELELDFDRQTKHSNSGQNPDSAVRRRLIQPRNGSVCYKKIQGIICGS